MKDKIIEILMKSDYEGEHYEVTADILLQLLSNTKDNKSDTQCMGDKISDAEEWLLKNDINPNFKIHRQGDDGIFRGLTLLDVFTQFAEHCSSSQHKPQIPSEKEKALDVEGIIRKYLDRHGYDGLYSDFCGCETTDLVPCDNNPMRCKPGYMHIGKATDEHDFYIKSKPLTKK